MPDGLDLFQNILRRRNARRTDQYPVAAKRRGGFKAMLVRDVVTEEQGNAARHRLPLHEDIDRRALVDAAGPEFVEHLARLHEQSGFGGDGIGQRLTGVRPLEGSAEMKADAQGLALDQEAGFVLREGVERVIRPIHRIEARGSARRFAGERYFEAVGAREKEIGKTELIAKGGHGPAADDGESAVEGVTDAAQQGMKFRIDLDRVRRIGEGDEGSVEIEEKRRAVEQFRRGRGKDYQFAVGHASMVEWRSANGKQVLSRDRKSFRLHERKWVQAAGMTQVRSSAIT